MAPIITSLLDTDLYKFTMWQAMLHRNPQTAAHYRFACRNATAFPLAELAAEVQAEIDQLCSLRFTKDELDYVASLRYIKSDFIDFLRLFQYQRDFITVKGQADGSLSIEADGPQVHVMGFEIPVLCIVNELYFRRLQQPGTLDEGRKRLQAKIAQLRAIKSGPTLAHPFEVSDFGLRRRFSGPWQREVVTTLAREVPQWFKGTSSVLLARDLDISPIGTMAHEYMQSYQSQGVRLRDFQKAALEDWVQEYRGDLGIALTDTVGMNAFLADFDLYFAKLFDGLRHDSGDPFEWGEKALAHYRQLRINTHSKRLVFSDGLDLERALALWRHFGPHIQLGFGIGTNLTNDLSLTPLNIVMKLTHANGQPVAKISDTPGKTLCEDETYLAYLRQVFHIEA
ncbi:nicotinate phosphoribosyltransferase [Comamonas sp. GB3 AK4-5]|uniref:nicotinate phosphoribosyltransferase n=1 Tax=Comamonas sp. GB3 AK4-5 TaxID=3231487 RepID=UPI00351E151F